MYNLVLVDDKKDIVQGISAALDWAAKNVCVHCFYNGAEALEYCLQNPPDFVITDICMPRMSGLELARAVLQQFPHVRFIILTGYDDFSYARDALRLGVVEYLSKPVRIETIEHLVDQQVTLLQKQRTEESTKLELWRKYQKSLPSVKRRWLLDAVEQAGPVTSLQLQAQMKEMELPLENMPLMVLLLEMEPDTENWQDAGQERLLVLYALENMGKELLGKKRVCEAFRYGENYLAFLVNCEAGASDMMIHYELYTGLQTMQGHCREMFGLTFSAGISPAGKDFSAIGACFAQAQCALGQTFFCGGGMVRSCLDLKQDGEPYPFHLQRELEKALLAGNAVDANAAIEALFSRVACMTHLQPAAIRAHLLECVLQLCRYQTADRKLSTAEALEHFNGKRTLQEIKEWMLDAVAYFMQPAQNGTSEIEKSIFAVKKYIDTHYAQPVTLKKMAEQVYISPAYLSFSFKDVLGVNFNDYLTQVRMEKAKQLLCSTSCKVYEICEMVGYKDKKYFSDLFKKHTGYLPKEYSRKDMNQ